MVFSMNETLHVIADRRSIRLFKADQIPGPELDEILAAGLYAPNARNMQKWHFTVIQNAGLLDRMVEVIKENMANCGVEFLVERSKDPAYHTFYHAPTVVMLSGPEDSPFAMVDCGTAVENMAIAAESLEIGSCVMAAPGLLFASENGNAMRGELGIPEGFKHVICIALGYAEGEKPEVPPRDSSVINFVK
jgi:nitroreductase